jgi:hypothetical protein
MVSRSLADAMKNVQGFVRLASAIARTITLSAGPESAQFLYHSYETF